MLRLALLIGLLASTAEAGCPSGFVPVQSFPPYTTQNYCVMQHEARSVNGVATSTSTGSPWHLSHNSAQTACEALGTGYNLPSNALWQAMARQAEWNPANWSGGEVGKGTFAATVTLPNGSVLNNVGNGVWEHVGGRVVGTIPAQQLFVRTLADADYPQTFSVGGVSGTMRYHFGPSVPMFNDTGNLSRLGWITAVYKDVIMRGGDNEDPGLFGAALNHPPDDTGTDVGFRCACSFYWCY